MVQGKVQPSGLTPTVHHTAREQGMLKKPIKYALTHSYLFVIFPPLTLPLSIFLARHTNPSPCVLWLALLCLDSTTFSQFLLPEFFTNNTKLGGISCLCIPHRNTLSKIKGTSFKWGGKSRTGGIMGGCVCVCAVVSSGHIAIVRKRLRFIKK